MSSTTIPNSASVSTALVLSTASSIPGGGSCDGGIETIPDHRPACAVLNGGNNTSAFYDLTACCDGEPIHAYGKNNCFVYCLAQYQTVGQLINCLEKQEDGAILCNGNLTAMGNESTVTPITTSVSGSATATRLSSSTLTSSSAAMPGVVSHTHVSKAALGMLAVLFVGSAAGLFL